jgi:hypothetical protein
VTQTIARIYESHQQATDAVSELKKASYTDDQIILIGHSSGYGTDSDTDQSPTAAIVLALIAAKVGRANATIYAEDVRQGGAIVVVHAPFGTATEAIRILGEHDPVGPDEAATQPKLKVWDESTPFSSALRLPLLLLDGSSFSSFWNLPLLADKLRPVVSSFGFPLLSKDEAFFSWLPMLLQAATPLSSILGLPTLSRSLISQLLNIPLLPSGRPSKWSAFLKRQKSNPAPLSTALGLPVISKGGAVIGFVPALSNDATPISSMLHMPVLAQIPPSRW